MHNDCPGRRVCVPFKSCPGFVGGLNEIDTCTQGGHSTVKNKGGAGSIVWGLRFWLEKIFRGSSKILI